MGFFLSGLAAHTNPITSLGKCPLSRAWQPAEQHPWQKQRTAPLRPALHAAEKTQALPPQEQTCENRGPYYGGRSVFVSRAGVPC